MTRLLLLLPLLTLAACSGDERPQTCGARCGGGGSQVDTGGDATGSGSGDTGSDSGADTDEDTLADSSGSADSGEVADTSEDTAADTANDTANDTADSDGSSDVEIDAIEGSGQTVEEFVTLTAATICGKLSACCDGASVNRFFAPFLAAAGDPADLYAAYTASIPPNAPLDAATCPALLRDLYLAGPFGSWAAKVAAGEATFASYAAEGCRQTIAAATCGAELEAAISYGSCVDIAAPEPGTQRPMFLRTQGPGAACSSIRDGFGGLYYGTCDPTVSFCCQGTGGRCGLPTGTSSGVCVAAAQEGESCSYFGDITLCATGLDCDFDSNSCVSSALPELGRGDTCFDAGTNDFVGACVDSWCDFFGTGRCESLVADGGACFAGEECEIGNCASGVCAASSFCLAP